MSQMAAHEFQVGPQGAQARALPASGVTFERIMPNGDIEWRLRCEQGNVWVNCLNYSRWHLIWPEVKDYLRQSLATGAEGDQAVQAVILQYVDVFNWEGDVAGYSLNELLRLESDFLPEHLQNCGPIWHQHSGWFEAHHDPTPGSVLKRVHFDATMQQKTSVRMDTLQKKDLTVPIPMDDIQSDSSRIEAIFDWMHSQNTLTLKNYLQADVLEEIGLGAEVK